MGSIVMVVGQSGINMMTDDDKDHYDDDDDDDDAYNDNYNDIWVSYSQEKGFNQYVDWSIRD